MPARKKRPITTEASAPKTTRPTATSRRAPERATTAAEKMGKTLDAFPDRIDVRDWFYQPTLAPLPDQIINCDAVPAILDQGQEGACTGFALAAVINYHLRQRNLSRRVSPRMLYEMARRYDQWPGDDYEGSSARGAMIGFVRHGVCTYDSWPSDVHGTEHFSPLIAREALGTPGGAYYRVMHKQVRDVHAALNEVGVIYMTLMVHEGWQNPGGSLRVHYAHSGNSLEREFPVITRRGRADGGHAVAIVGYTRDGFIIQNSWGTTWGAGGFALLPYEDYMLHATDVWAVQLGVPTVIDLWTEEGFAESTAGIQRASRAIPLNEIRPYVVDVGNNGKLSDSGDYWTTEEDVKRLFEEHIPQTARNKNWKKKRVMLYLHGGLNDEAAVARRIVAFRDVCLQNEIYPLHIMWETGVFETLKSIIADYFTDEESRAGGVAEWLRRTREGLIEAKDRTFELTTARIGRALWREMKENARLSSKADGGMGIILKHARASLAAIPPQERKAWEVHIVAHSAGSIFAAYTIPLLVTGEFTFKSVQFLAPAATNELFKEMILPHVQSGACPPPVSYVLSNTGELDDDVGPYGKSLLYLVSNAFEEKRETPIVGMEKFVHDDPAVAAFFSKTTNNLPRLIIAGKGQDKRALSRSETHGGFDNDVDTLNSVLFRILGDKPVRPFKTEDLQY